MTKPRLNISGLAPSALKTEFNFAIITCLAKSSSGLSVDEMYSVLEPLNKKLGLKSDSVGRRQGEATDIRFRSAISNRLDNTLINLGVVTKSTSERRGKNIVYTLTEEGRKFFAQNREANSEFIRTINERLDAQEMKANAIELVGVLKFFLVHPDKVPDDLKKVVINLAERCKGG